MEKGFIFDFRQKVFGSSNERETLTASISAHPGPGPIKKFKGIILLFTGILLITEL